MTDNTSENSGKTSVFLVDDHPLVRQGLTQIINNESDLEVTGELLARLWVSSTAPDTDFTIKLIDVYPANEAYPDGFAMNLQDSVVRMRYRNGKRKADLIEPGTIYEVELPFNPTSNLFQRGHRLFS